MTRLKGYSCDQCHTESRDKPGTWYQVLTLQVTRQGVAAGSALSASTNYGSHYCSAECLLNAMAP